MSFRGEVNGEPNRLGIRRFLTYRASASQRSADLPAPTFPATCCPAAYEIRRPSFSAHDSPPFLAGVPQSTEWGVIDAIKKDAR